MQDKRFSLKEAVANCIADGDSVVLGACLESDIPFAVTFELIRQGKRDLRMIAPISDASTDMLIGAGVASGVIGAWVGNVSGGLGHNYRRAVETGIPQKVRVEDYSNFTLGMALTAGAYGMPYIPVHSILGSDIAKSNPNFRLSRDPFADQPVIQVPPLKPDVAVFSVQRADLGGNCHHWGSAGVMQEAGLAAKKIILVADEIVAPEVIASDPSRVPFPGFLVTAVVHEPAGQHPSPMTGTWKRDNKFFNDYHAQSRDRAGFAAWLDEWVFTSSDHEAYRAKLGTRLEELRIRGQALAAPANYAAE
jgi:glutaconate CoA-transferase subunit A